MSISFTYESSSSIDILLKTADVHLMLLWLSKLSSLYSVKPFSHLFNSLLQIIPVELGLRVSTMQRTITVTTVMTATAITIFSVVDMKAEFTSRLLVSDLES